MFTWHVWALALAVVGLIGVVLVGEESRYGLQRGVRVMAYIAGMALGVTIMSQALPPAATYDPRVADLAQLLFRTVGACSGALTVRLLLWAMSAPPSRRVTQ